MYLLSTELRGPNGQRVTAMLPCPEAELTRWLAASQGNVSGEQLAMLVRSSPTLLLIAISRAVDCTGAPVRSMLQLLTRLEHCFNESGSVETALGHITEIQPCDLASLGWDVESEATLARFRRAKDRRQLVKSLARFIRQLNKQTLPKSSRPDKQSIRKLIDSMFADSFSVKRHKLLDPNWPDDIEPESSHDVSSVVLGLLKDRFANQKGYEQRLLDEKLAAMKQLAYGASHEINNPLANIATRAHTMLAEEKDPDRRFQLAVIHEQAMRAHDMISDMMLFAHPPELRLETVDVRAMIRSLVRELERNSLALSRCGASLSVTVGKDVAAARLDPTHCKVALANLIQNAAEAIRHDDGEIDVRVSVQDDSLCFGVSDNGVGIEEDVKQHLFDPFYSGREAGRGLGFGLSKSWRIAKLHGGSLDHRVDAKDLRTVFELRLPST